MSWEIDMAKVKHLRSRKKTNGSIVWEVAPPAYIKQAIQATFEVFTNKNDAVEYAKSIADQYHDYSRGVMRNIHIQEHSVAGLVAAYKNTDRWRSLKPKSKESYNQHLKAIFRINIGESTKMFQDMFSRTITVEHAEKIYAQRCSDVSKTDAFAKIKILRLIWSVGNRLGKTTSNPFAQMRLKSPETRKVLWTPEQVQVFISTADELNYSAIGTFALLCYDLCQRPGDMRQLTWSNYDRAAESFTFNFTQEKTGMKMGILASPRLAERMKTVRPNPRHDYILYYEATGNPYDRRLYNVHMQKVRKAAKLPSFLKLADLRRTGATEMAESGCTNSELRSVTGHKSMEVLKIYVRPTVKLANQAVNKRFAKQVPATAEGAVQ